MTPSRSRHGERGARARSEHAAGAAQARRAELGAPWRRRAAGRWRHGPPWPSRLTTAVFSPSPARMGGSACGTRRAAAYSTSTCPPRTSAPPAPAWPGPRRGDGRPPTRYGRIGGKGSAGGALVPRAASRCGRAASPRPPGAMRRGPAAPTGPGWPAPRVGPLLGTESPLGGGERGASFSFFLIFSSKLTKGVLSQSADGETRLLFAFPAWKQRALKQPGMWHAARLSPPQDPAPRALRSAAPSTSGDLRLLAKLTGTLQLKASVVHALNHFFGSFISR